MRNIFNEGFKQYVFFFLVENPEHMGNCTCAQVIIVLLNLFFIKFRYKLLDVYILVWLFISICGPLGTSTIKLSIRFALLQIYMYTVLKKLFTNNSFSTELKFNKSHQGQWSTIDCDICPVKYQ